MRHSARLPFFLPYICSLQTRLDIAYFALAFHHSHSVRRKLIHATYYQPASQTTEARHFDARWTDWPSILLAALLTDNTALIHHVTQLTARSQRLIPAHKLCAASLCVSLCEAGVPLEHTAA